MSTKYTKIDEGIEARVQGGHLYVRLTGIRLGMLVRGERAGRVYRISYSGTLQEAIAGYKETAYTAISRAMDPDHGEVIRQGRLIQ